MSFYFLVHNRNGYSPPNGFGAKRQRRRREMFDSMNSWSWRIDKFLSSIFPVYLSGTKFALWYFPRILYSWYFYTIITRRTHQIDQKRVRFFYIRNFLFPWTATAINGVNGTCSSGSGQFVSRDSTTTQLRPGVWRGEIVMLSTRLGILICLVHLTRWAGKKKWRHLSFHRDYNSQWEVKKMQAFDDSTPFLVGGEVGRSVGHY